MGDPSKEVYKEKLKEKYAIDTSTYSFDMKTQYDTEQDYFQMHMLALDERKQNFS